MTLAGIQRSARYILNNQVLWVWLSA